jgi:RNA polymerase sigma-70 factor (ECF subfamily)
LKKASRSPEPASSQIQLLACQAHELVLSDREDAARAAYDELVVLLQRRASRIAYHYLRNPEEADEAVQDAFVKAYVNLRSYKEYLPFDAWFARILVNSCLDRLKKQRRRDRWHASWDTVQGEPRPEPVATGISPEHQVVASEVQRSLGQAIDRLPDRQRLVVLLMHLEGRTPREVSAITGLNESTVRVHLFRAIRRLRRWLEPAAEASAREREA